MWGVGLLAVGGLRAPVHVDEGLSGLLGVGGFLGGSDNTAVLGSLNTDGLNH